MYIVHWYRTVVRMSQTHGEGMTHQSLTLQTAESSNQKLKASHCDVKLHTLEGLS